jgi:hypothetical protein
LDEQRQVVQQWKKKTQKIANETSDLRLLLEEQNNRNIMLEKRQKKFDSECQVLQVMIFEKNYIFLDLILKLITAKLRNSFK